MTFVNPAVPPPIAPHEALNTVSTDAPEVLFPRTRLSEIGPEPLPAPVQVASALAFGQNMITRYGPAAMSWLETNGQQIAWAALGLSVPVLGYLTYGENLSWRTGYQDGMHRAVDEPASPPLETLQREFDTVNLQLDQHLRDMARRTAGLRPDELPPPDAKPQDPAYHAVRRRLADAEQDVRIIVRETIAGTERSDAALGAEDAYRLAGGASYHSQKRAERTLRPDLGVIRQQVEQDITALKEMAKKWLRLANEIQRQQSSGTIAQPR